VNLAVRDAVISQALLGTVCMGWPWEHVSTLPGWSVEGMSEMDSALASRSGWIGAFLSRIFLDWNVKAGMGALKVKEPEYLIFGAQWKLQVVSDRPQATPKAESLHRPPARLPASS